jgi:hypothetical protein
MQGDRKGRPYQPPPYCVGGTCLSRRSQKNPPKKTVGFLSAAAGGRLKTGTSKPKDCPMTFLLILKILIFLIFLFLF